jgi:hypothetical protein
MATHKTKLLPQSKLIQNAISSIQNEALQVLELECKDP